MERRDGAEIAEVVIDDMAIGNPASSLGPHTALVGLVSPISI